MDPDPHVPLTDPVPRLTRLERRSLTELPLERFLALEAGDIPFVDTAHTVTHGSEVNFLIRDVLPRLGPGVVVHLQDMFFPYESRVLGSRAAPTRPSSTYCGPP